MSSPPVPAALARERRAERVGESAGRPDGDQRQNDAAAQDEQRHDGGGEHGDLPGLASANGTAAPAIAAVP
jgi:hypothetical protein